MTSTLRSTMPLAGWFAVSFVLSLVSPVQSAGLDAPAHLAAIDLPAELPAVDAGPGGVVPRHTELRESHPDDGAVVEDVREVLLVFTTPVQLGLSRVRVTLPDGTEIPAGDVEHPDEGSTDRLRVEFPGPLDPGSYRVEWSTAGPDGHVLGDTLAFTVAGEVRVQEGAGGPDTVQSGPAETAGTEERLDAVPVGTFQRWLHLLGTVLLIGVVAFRYGVVVPAVRRTGLSTLAARAERRLRFFGWIAVVLLLVTLGTRLWHQLVELGGGGEVGWEFLPHLLFRTAWGGGWFLHLAALGMGVIGLVALSRAGSESRGWVIVAGSAVVLPLVPALQGHAMASDLRAFTVPVLYAHIGVASVWLGGLLMLVLVGLPSVRKLPDAPEDTPPLARLVNRFSRMALLAVAAIVVSGVAVVTLYGPGLDGIMGSAWGRTLLIKLAVVAGAFLLGFYNWRRVRPTLSANPDPGALRIPATLEAFLGLLVLLVASVLAVAVLP